METFKFLKIRDTIIEGLNKEGITTPTAIQKQTIHHALDNEDLIAEAITGSGKTLCYVLPSFEKIDTSSKELHTLILAPTHELVVQINNVVKNLAKDSNHPIRSTPILGEVNIKRQIESLKSKPHIIVGTPGRVLELIKLKKIKAHQIKTVVIDEADKLLSQNYIETTKSVIKTTLRDRQIMVFSASINQQSIHKAMDLMKEPKIIKLVNKEINTNIEHLCIVTYQRDKINTLRRLINATKPVRAIVFINKNELIQEVVTRLNFHKINTVGLFGNMTKSERKSSLDSFRGGKAQILVASDLVARGLDLENISHVINLDIPPALNEYIHRVGRTGRANNSGTAVSIITEREIEILIKLEELYGLEFKPKVVYGSKLIDQVE